MPIMLLRFSREIETAGNWHRAVTVALTASTAETCRNMRKTQEHSGNYAILMSQIKFGSAITANGLAVISSMVISQY